MGGNVLKVNKLQPHIIMKNKLPYTAPVCEEDFLEPESSILDASPMDINYDLPDVGDDTDF